MPRETPINGKSGKLIPRTREEKPETTKLIKFELNYNNTRIVIESDNEETLNDVLDVIKDTCADEAPIRKLLVKE